MRKPCVMRRDVACVPRVMRRDVACRVSTGNLGILKFTKQFNSPKRKHCRQFAIESVLPKEVAKILNDGRR